MDFLSKINEPEEFSAMVKDVLDQKAFTSLEGMKKEMANEFLQDRGDED